MTWRGGGGVGGLHAGGQRRKQPLANQVSSLRSTREEAVGEEAGVEAVEEVMGEGVVAMTEQ